jgi:hypothetical protein
LGENAHAGRDLDTGELTTPHERVDAPWTDTEAFCYFIDAETTFCTHKDLLKAHVAMFLKLLPVFLCSWFDMPDALYGVRIRCALSGTPEMVGCPGSVSAQDWGAGTDLALWGEYRATAPHYQTQFLSSHFKAALMLVFYVFSAIQTSRNLET